MYASVCCCLITVKENKTPAVIKLQWVFAVLLPVEFSA